MTGTASDVTTTFGYNADNRPATITNTTGPTLSFISLYDGDGTRVAQIINGVMSAYFMGGAYEMTGSAEKKYYSIGGQTILYSLSSGLQYLLTDQQGSTVGILNASGTLVTGSEQRYLPFGKVRSDVTSSSTATDFGYTGQRSLASIGLSDFKARFYDASIGRFISPDTIVSNPTSPQTWNRYSYGLNNPVRFTDPTGHGPCDNMSGSNREYCLASIPKNGDGGGDEKLRKELDNFNQPYVHTDLNDPNQMVLIQSPFDPNVTTHITVEEKGLFYNQDGTFNTIAFLAAGYDAFMAGKIAEQLYPGPQSNPNGPQNAFQHAYWNALLSRDFGSEFAKNVTDAHEHGFGSERAPTFMDLHNNEVGRRIAEDNRGVPLYLLQARIYEAVQNGQMVVLDEHYDPYFSNQLP